MKINSSKSKVIFLAISLILFISCGKNNDNVIKIGVILPLSGSASFLGKGEQNAIIIASEEINKNGGVNNKKIEVSIEDCKSTAKDGLLAFHKLKAQGIKFFIVSMTTVAKTTLPIIEKNELLQFALSADPFIAEESDYTFRVYYGLDQEVSTMVEFVKEKKAKKVSVLYLNTPEIFSAVNEVLAKKLDQNGIRLISSESFSFSTKDTKSLITKITSNKPDWIIAEDYGTLYPNIIENLSLLNFQDRLIGGIGFLGIPVEKRNQVENIPFVAPKATIHKSEGYEDFIKKYKEKYNELPFVPFDAILAYDNFNILLEGIKMGGTKPAIVRSKLIEKGVFKGAIGSIYLDKFGRASFETSLGKYINGEIEKFQK